MFSNFCITKKWQVPHWSLPEFLFLFLPAARVPVVTKRSICQLEGGGAVAVVVLEGEG